MTTRSDRAPVGSRRRRWLAGLGATTIMTAGLALAGPGNAIAAESFTTRMVDRVNQARAANGLPALARVGTLDALAEDAPYSGCGFTVRGRAHDMGQRQYFGHAINGCGGRSVFDMMAAAGLQSSASGENVGWMAGTANPLTAADALHDGFMNSASHRSNVLDGRFNAIGVGSWFAPSGTSWSGAGAPRSNVVITAVVFATLPPGSISPPPPPAPTVVPGAPHWVALAATDGGVTAAWPPVPAASNAPIDGYAALLFDANGYTGRHVPVCGTCTSAHFGGLANGTNYAVGVLAGNAAGWGAATFSTWVVAGTPSPPGNVSATSGPSRATATWTAPARTNGAPVEAYAALAYDSTGSFTGHYSVACGTCSQATVTGLAPGRTYKLLVLAYSARGWGAGAFSGWVTVTG